MPLIDDRDTLAGKVVFCSVLDQILILVPKSDGVFSRPGLNEEYEVEFLWSLEDLSVELVEVEPFRARSQGAAIIS